MTTMKGRLLVLEGIDGCGKTTQLQQLSSWLPKSGLMPHESQLVVTREPGGTALGASLRQLLLHPPQDADPGPTAELLLYAADRAQHVDRVIQPALERGDWVLSDRFTGSTMAYQGYGRGLDRELITDLKRIATRGLSPDMTVWLDIPLALSVQRRGSREEDRIEAEGLAFLERVSKGFTAMAQARGWVSGTWFVGLGGRHIEGGALQVTDAATANVTTTSFAGCGALRGGAVAVGGEHSAAWTVGAAAEGAASRVAVEGCLFNRNAAVGGAGDGGAIYAAAPNGTDVAPPTVDVTQCTLLRNTAYRGGGVYAANATVAVSRSVVRDNTAMFGGGIEFDAASVASVTMTWFLDNIAGLHGGGMRAVESVLTADACVFDGNRAHLTDGYGGGVSVYDGSVATMTRIVVGTVSMSRDQVLAVACNTRTDFQSNTTVFNTVSVIDGAGATGSVDAACGGPRQLHRLRYFD